MPDALRDGPRPYVIQGWTVTDPEALADLKRMTRRTSRASLAVGWWGGSRPTGDARRRLACGGARVASLPGGDNGRVTVDLRDSRIAEVCRRYGVAELSVFGSVARGEDTDSSDVDLLYVLAPDSTLGFEIVDLRDELEMIVGRRVDLVPKSRLKWVIRDRVLAEARVLQAA